MPIHPKETQTSDIKPILGQTPKESPTRPELPEEEPSEPEDAATDSPDDRVPKPTAQAVEKMLTQAEARCAAIAKRYSEYITTTNRKIASFQKKLDSPGINKSAIKVAEQAMDKLAKQADMLQQKKNELQQLERQKVHEALGQNSPYAVYQGELIPASKLEAIKLRESAEREQWKADDPLHGTPRIASDEYIKMLLQGGFVQKAIFLEERNDLICACINTGAVQDWPDRLRSLHYQVQYISTAGFAMQRQAYVIVFKTKNGLWYVSTDTYMETLHF
jgi:hypothetical protein